MFKEALSLLTDAINDRESIHSILDDKLKDYIDDVPLKSKPASGHYDPKSDDDVPKKTTIKNSSPFTAFAQDIIDDVSNKLDEINEGITFY